MNACAKLTERVQGHLRVELNARRISEFTLLVLVQTARAFRNVCHYTSYFGKTDYDVPE